MSQVTDIGFGVKMSSGEANQPAGKFQRAVVQNLERQSAPYAFFCIQRNDVEGDNARGICLSRNNLKAEVKRIINDVSSAEIQLVVDNDNHLAVIANPSTLIKTNRLARVLRNQLMRNQSVFCLSMAVAQIDSFTVKADDLLSDMCSDLNRNVDEGSSRVEVRHYKP